MANEIATRVTDELARLLMLRAELDAREVVLIEAALDEGETFASFARLYGFSRQAAGERYRKLGGARRLSAGRPRKQGRSER